MNPTGRGANDTNHANADINISYLMGLNHLRSLICTYSAGDLRPLMTERQWEICYGLSKY